MLHSERIQWIEFMLCLVINDKAKDVLGLASKTKRIEKGEFAEDLAAINNPQLSRLDILKRHEPAT